MMDEPESFGLELILAEETAVQPQPAPAQPATTTDVPRTAVFEELNVTLDGTWYIAPEDDIEGGVVPGPGTLDTLLLIGDTSSNSFAVSIQSPDGTLLSDDFSTLEGISGEMSHVAAYTRNDDKRVISVSDLPFQERLSAQVQAANVTFDRIRGVFTLEGEADY